MTTRNINPTAASTPSFSVLEKYKSCDIDSNGDPQYFGFMASDATWYILELTGGSEARYFKGTTDYTTNWTNRASHAYDLFGVIF